ncbi:unnamed protein product [Alopecurus aequalis]
MEPTSKRPFVSAADAGVVLPPDVLWEILLRVPARPLCRFRAACGLWRSLLSDPSFVNAHAALHPDLIVALAGDYDRIDMTDLSGSVVRQIHIAPEDVGVPYHAHPGPLYLFLDHNRVRVVDPDTGAVSTLPCDDLQHPYKAVYALGRVASTGQHKVLRVVSRYTANRRMQQHCGVFTLGGDDCWRPMASAPLWVEFHAHPHHIVAHNAVIKGVVYFLPDRKFPSLARYTNCVMAFDLEAEEWRPATLPGPPAINDTCEDFILKLTKLKGSLVMIRHSGGSRRLGPMLLIDMWFATDLEKGLWVKEHRLRLEMPIMSQISVFAPEVHLLRVLDDGRVVFYYSGKKKSWPESDWRIRIYYPRTKSCTDVPQHGVCYIVGMYGGSMLCLDSR